MVQRISLHKLKGPLSDVQMEVLLRETRVHLLRLQEIRTVRCGKRIPQDQEWDFFISTEFETREKMLYALNNPVYIKLQEVIIAPAVGQTLVLEFETDPLKDTRYS